MRSVTDSLGRLLHIPTEPQRIISLCPSQTETLFALGLAGRIVGRTRYCIHPAEAVRTIPVVGGTKKVDIPAVRALEPDLIIAEKEENTPQDVELLSEIAPVYVTNVESYEQALISIVELGDITGKRATAENIVRQIKEAFETIPRATQPLRVLYLIWRKPFMAAGTRTYINSIIERLGWQNAAAHLPARYPTIDDPIQVKPDIVLLSDEPYPFKEKHIPEVQQAWQGAEVRIVRGDYFSWYGVRMREAATYLAQLAEEIGKVR